MKIQIGETVRNMTDDEIAEHNQAFTDIETQAKAQADALAVKTVARKKLLTKLDITEAEAQLLLGGM